MIFDVETLGSDLGEYLPMNDYVTIYLATIWQDYKKYHNLFEEDLLWRVMDTIVHEELHRVIDTCIEGKPEEVDDHKIFSYLRVW